MYVIAAMSMKDELDRLESRAIDQYISLEHRKVHATKRSNAVVAKTAVTLLLASRRRVQR